MPIGNFTITLPTIGQASWGGDLNTILQQIADAIDTAVTVDGLDINSSLDLQGNALINVTALRFSTGTEPSGAGLWVGSDGELRFKDGDGNTIQFSENGHINITGTGGIGGDYVADNPGGLTFTTSLGLFTFIVPGGDPATLDCGDIQQGQAGNANRVTLKAPALPGSYDLTWPQTLPASLRVVTIDATGSLHHTDRPTLVDLTGTTSVRTRDLDATRNVAIGGSTLLSGAYYHIPAIVHVEFAAGRSVDAANVSYDGSKLNWAERAQFDIPLPTMRKGDRIRDIKFVITSEGSAGVGITGSLLVRQGTSNATISEVFRPPASSLGATVTISGSGMPYTVTGDASPFLRIRAEDGDTLSKVSASYDRPIGG